jgi:nitric oxide dioxygenase
LRFLVSAALTADECRLVQASFAQIVPVADEMASRVYDRLFRSAPELRRLFTSEFALQGAKLMEKLAVVVKGLDDLDAIGPLVRVLGRRHAAYGVDARDYDALRDAFFSAAEEQLGPAFDEDVKAAWSAAFATIAHLMIEADED